MGCDIHMFVEYKKEVKNNKIDEAEFIWTNGDYFKFNPYFSKENPDGETEFSRIELYGNRNYDLFATLVGVRDYTDSIIPVSNPKGLPLDCCPYVKEESEVWKGDGHTHSWLTLKELKDYQATQPTLPRTGLLSPADLIEFDKNGTYPQSWCQGTNQPGFERRDWVEENNSLIPLIERLQTRAKELMQYEWQEYDPANDEKIRIVFWFDN